MKRSPSPAKFLPAKPELFWALTDIPSVHDKQLPGSQSVKKGWTYSSSKDEPASSRSSPKSSSKTIAKPAQRPMIGRPASAPQLHKSKRPAQPPRSQSRVSSPARKLDAKLMPCHPGRELRDANEEASAMTVPIASYDRQKGQEPRQNEVKATRPGRESKGPVNRQKMAWQKLGYQPGLPRKPAAQSLIPRHISDLPNVLAHMERLKAEQLELAKGIQGEGTEGVEGVKIRTCKDVCVLEFPENGARLLVNRWRTGYSERQQPSRAQSAQGRRARSSPQLSRSTGFPCTPQPVQPVLSVQSAQKGSHGISVLHFELVGQAE
mmetsp:Transcript_121371/g.288367  ORF Transcript_121371/g.288367 Transcript_121371/m.288367 type:complete len:321 (-) Transcript_121371:58-1020(-)